MSYRTITVSIKSLQNAERLCKFAAMVARKFNAHLIGVHTVGTMDVYTDLMAATTVPQMTAFHQDQKDLSTQIKEIFERVTRAEDFIAEWREVDLASENSEGGVLPDWLSADLVIIGQSNPKN